MNLKLAPLPILRQDAYAALARGSAAPSSPSGEKLSPAKPNALSPTGAPSEKPLQLGIENKQDVVKARQEQSTDAEDIRQNAARANEYLKFADTHLEFLVSENTGRIVVQVVDTETEEIVRQIPPDMMRRFADRVTQMRGLLFDVKG